MAEAPRIAFVGCTASSLALLGELAGQRANIVGVVSFAAQRAAGVSGFSDHATRAAALGAGSLLVSANINDPDIVRGIADWSPDVLLVMAWPQLLRQPLLAVPRLGVIGRHNALLPARRGRAPVAWALIDGLSESGVTLFWMDAGVDSGDIIAQRTVPIAVTDYPSQVLARMNEATATMLRELVAQLERGECPRTPQDHARASYTHPRRPDMGLIDWQKPASRLYNFVRGLSHPYPGAFTYCRMQRQHIWASTIVSVQGQIDRPGRVLRRGTDDADIQTGDGVLRITLPVDAAVAAGDTLGWLG